MTGKIPLIDDLPDDELDRLNRLLPWRCYVLDSVGRRFGSKPLWDKKRSKPQPIPDRRITLLDDRFHLSDKSVLEVGCFEGIHTVALAQRARLVLAVDGRIENVVKTMVRCSFFGVHATVARWNVEEPSPFDPSADVLHHVGVLYHLRDPVAHLRALLPSIRFGVMFDTHVAPEAGPFTAYGDYPCYLYRERERADPFSGLYRRSRWLRTDDLLSVLADCGFPDAEVIERRQEKNGPRVLILAKRATLPAP